MKPGTRPPATTAHTTSSRSRKPRRNTIVPPLGPCPHPILWPAHPGRELPARARAPAARGATRAVNAAHTSSPPPRTASRRRVLSLAAPAIWAQIRPCGGRLVGGPPCPSAGEAVPDTRRGHTSHRCTDGRLASHTTVG